MTTATGGLPLAVPEHPMDVDNGPANLLTGLVIDERTDRHYFVDAETAVALMGYPGLIVLGLQEPNQHQTPIWPQGADTELSRLISACHSARLWPMSANKRSDSLAGQSEGAP